MSNEFKMATGTTLTIPKAGGRIKISGVSAPTAHTISITSELPWYASGTTSGDTQLVDLPANTYRERSFTLSASGVTASNEQYDGTATVSSSWTVTQLGESISITSTTPIAATATSITYTVTSTTNCRVRLTGSPLATFLQRDHSSGTSTDSFTIPANENSYAEYFELNAWSLANVSVSAFTQVEQEGAEQKYVTGISITNVAQIQDIPATGGVATYQDFTYVVNLNYSDGTSDDITSIAENGFGPS